MVGCAAEPAPAPTALSAPPAAARRSGFQDMGPTLQALQRDDTQNPGLLWVLEGESLWQAPAGPRGQRCTDCHAGEPSHTLRGVALRYPRYDSALGRPITLAQRIAQCRARQGVVAPAPDSRDLLALEAFVARQSRGLPIAPDDDPRLAPAAERGRALFERRLGALNLSCAQCHDHLAGGRLGGSPIPQGHPTGYPIYRLEWQGLGSLQRRLRGCVTGVRAEPWPAGAPEWVELELYLMRRAAGMALETPAVRP
ncbi:MAG: sulfur oxidation c-type cytochrome SoxA [Piscinibacter sp.]|nr:sulfur oxidation c-type cytochrome SoxA [Piscinibacter sp.]